MKNSDTPISFGEALIANSEAMDIYLRLPKHKQEEIVNNAVNINTTDEMKSYVENIIVK